MLPAGHAGGEFAAGCREQRATCPRSHQNGCAI